MRVNRPSRAVLGLAGVLVLMPAIWPHAIAAAADPDPRSVYVVSLAHGGTGCPQGTVAHSISDDRTVFTVIFDSYIAYTGPGVPVTESRKECQLNVNLHIPQGWSYTVTDITYRGYAELADGQTGTQTATYYFAGSSSQARVSTPMRGPTRSDYTIDDRLGISARVWSDCGVVVPLNIKSAVGIVGNPNAIGQLTNDSTDGKAKTILGLLWKQC